ncbi:hypothetical protein CDL15_Pgr012532 [Punica granatum]|uniref:Uncharacterized protein n=1 Tax=Punica granatum TaxID=22663 RepID=A0A218XXL9_PUNGR|nr:hypothetical protein CDL15_Pgr012532 [Punica granatum]
MEEAEKKRFREMYDRHYEAFGKTYQRTGFLLMEKFNVTADLSSGDKGSDPCRKIWKDTDLSKSIKVMEELLMRSISLRDGINEIKDRLCPLKDVHILQALKCTKASLNCVTSKLQPFKHGLA